MTQNIENRHPVDQLADVRAEIKRLGDIEKQIKETVSKMMGRADSLGGDEYIARQTLTTRVGSIDTAQLKAEGIDVDQYRKPGTVVHTLRIERREVEAAE